MLCITNAEHGHLRTESLSIHKAVSNSSSKGYIGDSSTFCLREKQNERESPRSNREGFLLYRPQFSHLRQQPICSYSNSMRWVLHTISIQMRTPDLALHHHAILFECPWPSRVRGCRVGGQGRFTASVTTLGSGGLWDGCGSRATALL